VKKETAIALRIVTAVVAALSLLGWVATPILRLSVDEFELPITVVCAIVPCFSAALALVLGAIAGGRGGWLSKTLNAIGACIIFLPAPLIILIVTDDVEPSIFLPISCGVQFVGWLIAVGGLVAWLATRNKEKASPEPQLDTDLEPSVISGKLCPACGAENPPDYGFCERCGSEL
jgi:hypothetical protein